MTAVERAARLVADEHGSDAFGPAPSSGEYAHLERDQYRAEAQAVIGLVVEMLRGLADGPEVLIDGPGVRLPVDATTAMRLLDRAADWIEKDVKS